MLLQIITMRSMIPNVLTAGGVTDINIYNYGVVIILIFYDSTFHGVFSILIVKISISADQDCFLLCDYHSFNEEGIVIKLIDG